LVFNAPCDVILSDTTVVQPDLVLLRASRKQLIANRGIEGVPDVAVEILSPSNKGQDEFLKRSLYERFEIPEYWIVDPNLGHLELLRLDGGTYGLSARFDRASTLISPAFPEISIPLGAIFAPH
jgi:Uma2 family endonuclease